MIGAWKIYGSFLPKMASLLTDTFKCALFTSTYVPAISDDSYTGLAGEVANGNGYVTGGAALTNVTFTETDGVWTLDCDDIVVFTANGADVLSKTAVIYNNTDAGKQLVAVMYLDTIYDANMPDGETMTIETADGIFSIGESW